MQVKPWQPRVVNDCLVETGPCEFDLTATKYAYLEFRDAGRIRNVTVASGLVTKLTQALGADACQFHLVSGQQLGTEEEIHLLVAVRDPQGIAYAIDMQRQSSELTISERRRVRLMGRALQAGGVVLGLTSLPFTLVVVGIPFLIFSIFMWRAGGAMARAQDRELALLETQAAMVSEIPGVRLL